jgi:hypothetical protein
VSPETLLAAPLVLGVVLVVSGIAKLRAPETDPLRALRDLHVPAALVRPIVARVHPWAEVLVGLALLLVPGPGRWVAAAAALALVLAYTWLVAAALRRREAVSCSCFGRGSEVVRRSTLARNLVLTGAAVLAVVDCVWTPAPLVRAFSSGLDGVVWVGALAAVGVLGWLIGLGQSAPAAAKHADVGAAGAVGRNAAEGTASGEDGDDVDLADERDPIPDIELLTATGERLRAVDLVTERAVVLVVLSPGCGACDYFLSRLDSWRALVPELAITPVRILAGDQPAPAEEPFPEHTGGLWISARDAHLLGAHATPTALLLGADGLIAGGPAVGGAPVRAMLGEIIEHLAGAA